MRDYPNLLSKSLGAKPAIGLSSGIHFVSAVHNNEDLSDIERFSYLRTLLEGPAYSTVAGLALTSANYEKAVDLLKQRFGQKQVIINSHMDHLLNLTPVTDSRDLWKLRKLYDTIEQDVRGLESLGVPVTSYGSLLVSVVQSRLPTDILIEIGKGMKLEHGEDWNLETLMKLLKVEIETRECVQTKGSNRGTFSVENKRPNYCRLRQPYTLQKAQETHPIAHIAVENILQLIVMWSQTYKRGKTF